MHNNIDNRLKSIAYLVTAASPGGFKIFVLALTGLLSTDIQGAIANDLAVVSFLVMLSAIGAGNQIVHIIPKEVNSFKLATELMNGLLLKLIPFIAMVCAALLFVTSIWPTILTNPNETTALLFTSSIYWIIRHYHIARQEIAHLSIMEATTWTTYIAGAYILNATGIFTAQHTLLLISLAYTTGTLASAYWLPQFKPDFSKPIIRQSIIIGVSNVLSGGVINLAPSLAFHLAGPAYAGAAALIVNVAQAPLTIVRAYLLRITPTLSLALTKSRESPSFASIYNRATSFVRKLLFLGFILTIPTASILVLGTQSNEVWIEMGLFVIAITSMVYAPQFSAVEATLINFFNKSVHMLILNTIHVGGSLVILFACNYFFNNGLLTLYIFVGMSTFFYFIRNNILNSTIRSYIATKEL